MTLRRLGVGFVALVIGAAPAAAQVVGKLPEKSTLQDLNDGQRWGVFGGWLTTGRDPVGIRGKSAPILATCPGSSRTRKAISSALKLI